MVRFFFRLIATGIAAVPFLMRFAETGFAASLFTALSWIILSWLIVDRLILPLTSHWTAVLSDGVLACSFLWFVADVMDWPLNPLELLIITATVTAVRLILHRDKGNPDRVSA